LCGAVAPTARPTEPDHTDHGFSNGIDAGLEQADMVVVEHHCDAVGAQPFVGEQLYNHRVEAFEPDGTNE
jgi:hypothetical protein